MAASRMTTGVFSPDELTRLQSAVDAVCFELGLTDGDGREAVAGRMMREWREGRRQNLDLVQAGLTMPTGLNVEHA